MDNFIGATPSRGEYRIEATVPVVVPPGTTPADVLSRFVEGMQAAYDDGMAGFFEVTGMHVDGEWFDAGAIVSDIETGRRPGM